MERFLGLDLGTNSMGWSIIERTDQVRLFDKGVHIFQEGVKVEKGVESSKAAEKTKYKALRKQYFRRKIRKVETLKVLSDFGFCPPLSIEQLKAWQTQGIYPATAEFIDWQRTNDDAQKNPYYCRYLAVTRKLNLDTEQNRFLLGRAFYHISQRRGFLSNRLESTQESDGDVKKGISDLSQKIEQAGCRYLGEYFYTCYQNGDKIRNQYTSRTEHYEIEFDAICALQQLPVNMRVRLKKALFFQRPLKSQKGQVGRCTFEKGKARSPASHPRYEEFRMLCFINNIKIQTPADAELRLLNREERASISLLFTRKSKESFDFEDIARKLAGKGNYAYIKDKQDKPYQFNYKMNTTVSGSPVTAQLISVFGDDWQSEIERNYTQKTCRSESGIKSGKEIINDIWHVLFSFNDEQKLREFARIKLRLDEDKACKFAHIKLHKDYASLSLNAIDKILPYLRSGLIYSHSVFLANVGNVLPAHIWEDEKSRAIITAGILNEIDDYTPEDFKRGLTLQRKILNFLLDNFELKKCAELKLYHPSMMETYPQVKIKESECWKLASPRTGAVRNPMAMRTLFQLRSLINQLLKEGKIDRLTKINIEMSRELNNANMRKAIGFRQKEIETENKKYRMELEQYFGEGKIPAENDVLKYRLWIEQDKKCLYTGKNIEISEFIGAVPKYDIEHTIPRSMGGDNSQMNKTLTDMRYNRDVKGAKMPFELPMYEDILVRIESWKEKAESLDQQIQADKKRRYATKEQQDIAIVRRHKLTLQRDYWFGKYSRFTMTEVSRGFRNSQGVDAGIISKYARLYLQSLFPKVYTIKGIMTAEFRKLWGLQDTYSSKDRSSHVQHCQDAIILACIGKSENDRMSEYYRNEEEFRWFGSGSKPSFEKPWKTFTEDVKKIANELLVSHYTADNLPKNTRKKVRIRGKILLGNDGAPLLMQGDTARGSLHQDTYYGAIMKQDEIKYVVRKTLATLKETDVDKIVDDCVREKVKEAVSKLGFKAAMASTIWMNQEKKIPIKKVRCFTPMVKFPLHIRKHRDESKFEYKRTFHVVNDSNYLMAIYEGTDKKGKIKRDFEVVNYIDAAQLLKRSTDNGSFSSLVPLSKKSLPLRGVLKTGMQVLFWKDSPEEIWELDKNQIRNRLYKIIVLGKDGRIVFKFHQEARNDEMIKTDYERQHGLAAPKSLTNGVSSVDCEVPAPKLLLSPGNFNMLVEGLDFRLTVLGEIEPLKK